MPVSNRIVPANASRACRADPCASASGSCLLGCRKNLFDPRDPSPPRADRVLRVGRPRLGRAVVLVLRSGGALPPARGHRHLALYLAVAIIVDGVPHLGLLQPHHRAVPAAAAAATSSRPSCSGRMPGVDLGRRAGRRLRPHDRDLGRRRACDAIFSFLPPAAGTASSCRPSSSSSLGSSTLNLRGVKESILVLTPIFLVFIVSHVGPDRLGVLAHTAATSVPSLADTRRTTRARRSPSSGWVGVGVIFLRAFSLGGGTFTGIEAVSNGVGILREPRVETGKRTMLYMATSLAFTAGGILLCYLLNDVAATSRARRSTPRCGRCSPRGWHDRRVRRRHGDRGVHAGLRGRAAVRRGADRLRRRPAHAGGHGASTSGCRSASTTSPSGSSTQNGVITMGVARRARARLHPRLGRRSWSSCTRSTCSSPSRSPSSGWCGTGWQRARTTERTGGGGSSSPRSAPA